MTKGEKDSRTLHNLTTQFRYSQMTPLFESFHIVGSKGELNNASPEILYSYRGSHDDGSPSFCDIEGLSAFCMPSGVERIPLPKKDKEKYQRYLSNRSTTIKGQVDLDGHSGSKIAARLRQSHHLAKNCYAFRLTNLSATSYGVCVCKTRAILGGHYVEQICLCLISLVPFIDLHIKFLQFIAGTFFIFSLHHVIIIIIIIIIISSSSSSSSIHFIDMI